jgi:hypothetical protein
MKSTVVAFVACLLLAAPTLGNPVVPVSDVAANPCEQQKYVLGSAPLMLAPWQTTRATELTTTARAAAAATSRAGTPTSAVRITPGLLLRRSRLIVPPQRLSVRQPEPADLLERVRGRQRILQEPDGMLVPEVSR